MQILLRFDEGATLDEEGRVVTIHPQFMTPTSIVRVATGVCETEAGGNVEKFELVVSGKDGKLIKRPPYSGVAAIDDPKPPKKTSKPATEADPPPTEEPNGEETD